MLGTTLGVRPHHDLASPEPALDDAPAEFPLPDHEVVGLDQAGDDGLAQSGTGVDDDLVSRPGDRVSGEQHSRRLGRHEALDDDGELHRSLVERQAGAIGDGAISPQRGPAPPHRLHQRLRAHHVQETVVLARERRLRQVLRRRARPHSDRTQSEPPVRGQDRALHLGRDWGRLERPPDRRGVVLAEHPGDRLAQSVVRDEAVVSRRGDHKARRHREAGADQLAQASALAPRPVQVARRHLRQLEDECRPPLAGRADLPLLRPAAIWRSSGPVAHATLATLPDQPLVAC